MAKDKKSEPKLVLEREYIVPLRRGWQKVPEYKRANKAVKTLKEFIVRHMKLYDRDLRKVKIDNYLNNEIRFKGMKKPLAQVKIKAKKYDNDIVVVELVTLPKHIQFAKARAEKISSAVESKVKEIEAAKPKEEAEDKEVSEEKKEETTEKEAASKEESLNISKEQAKSLKHTTTYPKEGATQNIGKKRASSGR